MKDIILRVMFLILLVALLIWQSLITLGVVKPSHLKGKKPAPVTAEVRAIDSLSTPVEISRDKPAIPTGSAGKPPHDLSRSPAKQTETPQSTTDKSQPTYTVDASKCISCRLCVNVCPVGAISVKDGKAVIDQDICIECGICHDGDGEDYQGCPVDAITKK